MARTKTKKEPLHLSIIIDKLTDLGWDYSCNRMSRSGMEIFDDWYDRNWDSKLTFDEEIELRDLALGVWEADDEDDLVEEITTASGWCIKSIDYEIQLK